MSNTEEIIVLDEAVKTEEAPSQPVYADLSQQFVTFDPPPSSAPLVTDVVAERTTYEEPVPYFGKHAADERCLQI